MTTTPNLNAALVELQAQLPRITKDLKANVQMKGGGAFSYSYADLSLISRETLPLLAKCGLAFMARPTMREARFVLVYELRHSSGEQVDGEYPLPERGTPQEIGSAITYARRYCLCAVTGVAPDDDDNDAIVAEKAAKRERRQTSQTKQPAAAVPPMTADQQKRLQNAFTALGMNDKERRLSYAMQAVGRNLKSATELSFTEAELVIARAESEAPKAAGEAA